VKIIIEPDYKQLSKKASQIVAAFIHDKPNALLVLPAGDTPLGMYQQLAQKRVELSLVFHDVRVLALDEWGGLEADHPMSCHYRIKTAFVDSLGLPDANFHSLDGAVKDPVRECRRYNQLLAKIGPVDLAILGLGLNGHIGFNEPAPQLPAEAHVVKLAPSTITRAKNQMGDDLAPSYGLTLGMAQIMRAQQVLLLASGHQKSDTVSQMLTGPISTEFPASLLQLHPAATFLMDEAAAGQLADHSAGYLTV
jgi:glucosamine-6-phosphate deaminase